ncbi:hypothetical protein [Candidatus Magnetaquicoccus inordinatus]|uniref:hypothetical protein n=1 Tax=Candidatus Magnetaquicoccus inordinatus TaxID=2496818 RepID=UPI003B9688EE
MSEEIYTFCAVLAYSGARLSEVLALKHEQIDLKARLVIIECLKKRRAHVYRAVPIPHELAVGLEDVHAVTAAKRDPVRCGMPGFCGTGGTAYCRTTVDKTS